MLAARNGFLSRFFAKWRDSTEWNRLKPGFSLEKPGFNLLRQESEADTMSLVDRPDKKEDGRRWPSLILRVVLSRIKNLELTSDSIS